MWKGYEWPAFLRFWTERLEILVRRFAETDGSRSASLLPDVVIPVIGGTGIVMSVSFLERIILDALNRAGSKISWVKLNNDDWAKELGMDLSWPGWPFIDILTRLRHCFAHEYGRATQKQINELQKLRSSLATNPIQITWVSKTYVIYPFFSIDPVAKEITLESSPTKGSDPERSPSQSFRIILLSFLEELEKIGVVDLQDWKKP